MTEHQDSSSQSRTAMPQPSKTGQTAITALPDWPADRPNASAWREQAIAQIYALRTIAGWVRRRTEVTDADDADAIVADVYRHLETASKAAGTKENPWKRFWAGMSGSDVERTMSHIDSAKAGILRLAPGDYVRGQLPALQALARDHLSPTDPSHNLLRKIADSTGDLKAIERDNIFATLVRVAAEARGEVTRVRSFRNLLVAATIILAGAAIGLAIFGALAPDELPLCFNPPGLVVCPTGEERAPTASNAAIETVVDRTADSWDVVVVELVGLLGAAVAAAVALSGIRGTSTPYSLPTAQAALKLPLGALTAVLGILLMRGEFIPGLTALDTPGQIVAWAVVFGYAQQLFTRLVDQQAQSVLEDVGGAASREGGTGATP